MNWDNNQEKTKAERRERKRRQKYKMRVVGSSVKLLWQIIQRKAEGKKQGDGK